MPKKKALKQRRKMFLSRNNYCYCTRWKLRTIKFMAWKINARNKMCCEWRKQRRLGEKKERRIRRRSNNYGALFIALAMAGESWRNGNIEWVGEKSTRVVGTLQFVLSNCHDDLLGHGVLCTIKDAIHHDFL
jgi:hypothetical protein